MKLAFFLALGLAASALGAQPGSAPRAPLPAFHQRLDLTVLELDVRVADARGQAVLDLARDDFAVSVGGHPAEVLSASPPADSADPAARRSLLVLVDELHLRPAMRERALRQLEGFLVSRLARGERVLLAAFDGALRGLAPLGADAGALRSALATLRAGTAALRAERLRATAAAGGPRGALDRAERARAVADLDAHARASLAALEELTRAAAGLDGPKALLYVGGWLGLDPDRGAGSLPDRGLRVDVAVEPDGLQAAQDRPSIQYRISPPAFGSPAGAAAPQLAPLLAAAQAYGVALYACALEPSLGAEGPGAALSRRGVGLEPLGRLASGSGGALLAGVDLATPLARLGRRLSEGYRLAASVADLDAGVDHSLEVAVRRPGLFVEHAPVARAAPAGDRLRDLALAALWLGSNDNPLRLTVAAAPGRREGRDLVVPVRVQVPLERLTLEPRGEGLLARLTLHLAVSDPSGQTSEAAGVGLSFPVERQRLAATGPGALVGLRAALKLRPGLHRLALVACDDPSGAVSALRLELPVGDAAR
jgi:VWFA-related protein